jgi:hypothetical protein
VLDPRPRLNDTLGVPPAYFDGAYECLFEMGAKLAHVLWRKMVPHENSDADAHLTNLIYDLVLHERYDLAIALADFALNTPPIAKHCDEDSRLRIIINLAQAHKWARHQERALAALRRDNWSTRSYAFQLAVAMLRDDFSTAAARTRKLGPDGGIDANDFRDWPLFQEFRKTDVFFATYQEVFGSAFQPLDRGPLHFLFTHKGTRMIGPATRAISEDATGAES